MNALASIARSGLAAAALRLQATAHNVANLGVSGAQRQFVQQEEQAGGGVSATLHRVPGIGPELSQDIVEGMQARHAFGANLRVMRTELDVLGSLLDVTA